MAADPASQPPTDQQLVSELLPAFQRKHVPGVTLIEHPVIGSRHRHFTIVWDRWAHLDQVKRSKIILDAFEKAQSPGEQWRVLEITLALGLTPAEANKLKIA